MLYLQNLNSVTLNQLYQLIKDTLYYNKPELKDKYISRISLTEEGSFEVFCEGYNHLISTDQLKVYYTEVIIKKNIQGTLLSLVTTAKNAIIKQQEEIEKEFYNIPYAKKKELLIENKELLDYLAETKARLSFERADLLGVNGIKALFETKQKYNA